MISILIRLGIAIVFAIVATTFLSMSLFFLREKGYMKNNIIIASIFAAVLFGLSYISNIVVTIMILLVTLLVIKYIYLKTWKETINIWGVWVGLWIVLIMFITTVVWAVKPFPTLI